MKRAKGARELGSYQLGQKLSLKQAILAKCFECTANYADGNEDCAIPECPLYPYMPYGATWMGREKKIIPVAQRKAMLQRLKRGRKQRGGDRNGNLQETNKANRDP